MTPPEERIWPIILYSITAGTKTFENKIDVKGHFENEKIKDKTED